MTSCIEVKRSDLGTYAIPGSAEVEDWDEVQACTVSASCDGELSGWGEWRLVYRVVDKFADVRWYFVEGQHPEGCSCGSPDCTG